MRGFLASIAVVVGLAGCGPQGVLAQGPQDDPNGAFNGSVGPLTTTDVDVAPECQGILTFANNASFATLDIYLPSDLVANIIAARPFSTLAGLSGVSQMGAVRLTQTHQGALTEGYITSSCVGIFDELAVSTDDQAALVNLVNTISDQEMHDILPYAWNGAVNLLGGRPYTTVAGISNTSGIGQVSLRNLRNAATLTIPFTQLGVAITNLHHDARLVRHFNWYEELQNALYGYQLNGVTCFGVDPDLLPNGSVIRPNLANASEVYAAAQYTVQYANRYGTPVDGTAGLANLQAQAAGKSFFGCYLEWAPDPWSGYTRRFFVDTVSGLGVLAETWWSE